MVSNGRLSISEASETAKTLKIVAGPNGFGFTTESLVNARGRGTVLVKVVDADSPNAGVLQPGLLRCVLHKFEHPGVPRLESPRLQLQCVSLHDLGHRTSA